MAAKILIADDERRLLELLERVLGKRGHEVETFPDGASAIEAIEAGGEYDLVLTDLRMPHRSGIEVLEASKKKRPKTPVLLITGATEAEDRARAEALGVYMVLHKPVDLAYLMTIVDAALDKDVAGAATASKGKTPGMVENGTGQGSGHEGKGYAGPLASGGTLPAIVGGGAPPSAKASAPEGAPAPAASAPAAQAPAPIGVRVIDREACLENMIAYCLKKQGYRVLPGASAQPPAIAIVGLLGAVEAVRKDAPKAVLIALYEQEQPDDAVRALEAGADVAVARPFQPEVLFAHVKAAARRIQPQDGAGPQAAAPAPGSREAVVAQTRIVDDRPISRNRMAAVRN